MAFIEKRDLFRFFPLVVFYSATFLYVIIVFRFYFMQKMKVQQKYFDNQEQFVTQLNLKNNVDDDNN